MKVSAKSIICGIFVCALAFLCIFGPITPLLRTDYIFELAASETGYGLIIMRSPVYFAGVSAGSFTGYCCISSWRAFTIFSDSAKGTSS